MVIALHTISRIFSSDRQKQRGRGDSFVLSSFFFVEHVARCFTFDISIKKKIKLRRERLDFQLLPFRFFSFRYDIIKELIFLTKGTKYQLNRSI